MSHNMIKEQYETEIVKVGYNTIDNKHNVQYDMEA